MGSGTYWVQVGAFKDAETARRLAAKLREDNFKVEESLTRGSGAARSAPKAPVATKAPSTDLGSDQYDVIVSGQTPEELTKRLSAKGLSAEASGGLASELDGSCTRSSASASEKLIRIMKNAIN